MCHFSTFVQPCYGKIWQGSRKTSWATSEYHVRPTVVLELEKQLQQWRRNLPVNLAILAPDRSIDPTVQQLVQLRLMLASEFHIVLPLHRPFLILSFSYRQKYGANRQACTQSARFGFLLRARMAGEKAGNQYGQGAGTSNQASVPPPGGSPSAAANESLRPWAVRSSTGASRVALSAIVLTIALIIGHDDPESDDIRLTMDTSTASGVKGSGLTKDILEKYAIDEVVRSHRERSSATARGGASRGQSVDVATPATEAGSVHSGRVAEQQSGAPFWQAQSLP